VDTLFKSLSRVLVCVRLCRLCRLSSLCAFSAFRMASAGSDSRVGSPLQHEGEWSKVWEGIKADFQPAFSPRLDSPPPFLVAGDELLGRVTEVYKGVLSSVPFSTVLSNEIMSAYMAGDETALDDIVTSIKCQKLGLDCIGLSRLLVLVLRENGFGGAYLVPAMSEKLKDIHLAVVLTYGTNVERGFVFMDVGLHFPLPILIRLPPHTTNPVYTFTNVGVFESYFFIATASSNGLRIFFERRNVDVAVSEFLPPGSLAGPQRSKDTDEIIYLLKNVNSFQNLTPAEKVLCQQRQVSFEFRAYERDGVKVASFECKLLSTNIEFKWEKTVKVKLEAWENDKKFPEEWQSLLDSLFAKSGKFEHLSAAVPGSILPMLLSKTVDLVRRR